MAFALWSEVGSLYNNNGVPLAGLHWDRSQATSSPTGDVTWVDTAANAAGYSVGTQQTYTIYATAQDPFGITDSPVVVDTTAMIFPFLTANGASATAAASVYFTLANGVYTGGIIYWKANSVSGYDLIFQPVQTAADVMAAGQALVLNGPSATLMSGVQNLLAWNFQPTGTGIAVAIAQDAGGSTRNISLQAFNTAGQQTTALVPYASVPNGTAFTLVTDGTNYFAQRESNTTPQNVLTSTFNASTGALASIPNFPTDWTDIYQIETRFAGAGVYAIGEGLVGSQHSIEIGFFTLAGQTFTQVGSGLRLLQTSTTQNHFQTTVVNGNLVIAYQDAGVVRLAALNQSGVQVDSTFVVPGITGFDRIRSLGDGRVEIDYRVSAQSDVQAMIFDMRTVGRTFTGTAGNDTFAGTLFDDTFIGTTGSDHYDGRGAGDTIDYSGLVGSINFTLNNATAASNDPGFANVYKSVGGIDVVRNIASVIGTAGNDIIVGNDASQTLTGSAGNDYLDGGNSPDKLFGGAGNDTIVYDANDDLANVLGGADFDQLLVLSGAAPTVFDLTAHQFEQARVEAVDTTNQPWATQFRIYDPGWIERQQYVAYDDGSAIRYGRDTLGRLDYQQEYNAAGTQVRYTDFDQATGNTWSSFYNLYDGATGIQTQKFTQYDDLSMGRYGYDAVGSIDWLQETNTTGVLVRYTDYDQGNTQAFASFYNLYDDAGGLQTQKFVAYHDNTSLRQGFDNLGRLDWQQENRVDGTLAYYTDWDQGNQFSWSRYIDTMAANGTTLLNRHYFNHDGTDFVVT